MRESERNTAVRHEEKRRFIAALICAAVILAAFLSSAYIVREAGHACTGADCPVCAGIRQCERYLKLLGTGGAAEEAAAALAALSVTAAALSVFPAVPRTTLVSQKVRLND